MDGRDRFEQHKRCDQFGGIRKSPPIVNALQGRGVAAGEKRIEVIIGIQFQCLPRPVPAGIDVSVPIARQQLERGIRSDSQAAEKCAAFEELRELADADGCAEAKLGQFHVGPRRRVIEIRRRSPSTKVLILTPHDDANFLSVLNETGADAYRAKARAAAELVPTIKHFCCAMPGKSYPVVSVRRD
jgi:hypothetical protein